MRILVIKLGALGDFVQAMGPAAAIRAHHPGDEITLLTTAPYAELGRAAPYFDWVLIDQRPRVFDLAGWWRLRRMLREGRFERVYDLQTSDRSSFYHRLMGRAALVRHRPRRLAAAYQSASATACTPSTARPSS